MGIRTSRSLQRLIKTHFTGTPTGLTFLIRLREGALTRDENPETHFCVYFAGYDPDVKEVFMGHHKKSDLWLVNGGHIDRGETPTEALEREIREEWGMRISATTIGAPKLLTLTHVRNNPRVTCTRHYDIWYFVRLNKETFAPDQTLLSKEFYETRWLSPASAHALAADPNTHQALSFIENSLLVMR